MKKYVTPYLFTLTFMFGLFFITSLLLVSSTYLISLSTSTYQLILKVASYIIIIASSILFIHFIPSKPLYHSILLAFLYLIISYLACNGVVHWLHLFLKPIVFIISCIVVSILKSDR